MPCPARASSFGSVSGVCAALAALALVLGGCAADPERRPRPISVGKTPDGLARVSTRGPGDLFVKQNHPVGSYDDIMVATIGIHYAPGQDELTEEQEDVIFDRMVATLYDGVARGFSIAKQPGPCTVKMGVYLKDVDFYESRTSGSQTRFVSSYGAATLVFEFRDSTTDEALVRYGQRRSFGAGVDAGGPRGPNLDLLGDTLEKMLEDVGVTLQEVLAPNVEGEAARGCQGNLGRALTES
jgi:hypothetical protein